MTFVIDASTVLSWHYPDERSERSDAVLDRLELSEALTPSIFWFELHNVLLLGERRRRSTQQETDSFLQSLDRLAIEVVSLPKDIDVFDLARRRHLTFYDACYLELAKREGLPLATFDKALISAARAEGIALIGA